MKKSTLILTAILIVSTINLFCQIINVPADQPTIQAGINAACTGDTVLVADGTYLENINFLGKAITVTSHFIMDKDISHIQNTIIDGSQPVDPDKGSVVSFESGEDTTSVISGFTITGGTGTLVPAFSARVGGGILFNNSGGKVTHNYVKGDTINVPAGLYGSGAAISAGPPGSGALIYIANNKIFDNYVETVDEWAEGGAIVSHLDAIIRHNEIYNNTAHSTQNRTVSGGLCMDGNYLELKENTFRDNKSVSMANQEWGGVAGAIFVANSTGSISGNRILNNEVSSVNIGHAAGLMLADVDPGLMIEHNIIQGNYHSSGTGRGGGLCVLNWGGEGNGLIYHNLITGNSATEGGGVYLEDINQQEFEFMGNTISDNEASGSGGGVYMASNSPCEISNSIIWGNTAPDGAEIYDPFNAIMITYSDVGEIVSGTGNINANPLFDTIWQYRLTENSPCLDAADPASPDDPDDTQADMGCYAYFQGTQINVAKG